MSSFGRLDRPKLIRAADTVFDALGVRPIGIVVFAASAILLVQVIGLSSSSIRVEGVAVASLVEHPSRLSSFVSRVFVRAGDRLALGAPLVELSPYLIEQEMARLDLEIEQLINESRLAQARLVIDEERWIKPALRRSPSRPSLESPTEAYYAKKLEGLHVRRGELVADRKALVVTAARSGVVTAVAGLGASVAVGSSVASMMPEFAEEIVAYLPPNRDALSITSGISTYMVAASSLECRRPGRVRTRGAAVEAAPAQLNQLLGGPLYGMPVFVELASNCRLGNGQVVTLDFRLGANE